jgi:hypothetical protein
MAWDKGKVVINNFLPPTDLILSLAKSVFTFFFCLGFYFSSKGRVGGVGPPGDIPSKKA